MRQWVLREPALYCRSEDLCFPSGWLQESHSPLFSLPFVCSDPQSAGFTALWAAPRGHPTRLANLNTEVPAESKAQHSRQCQSITTSSHRFRANPLGCSRSTCTTPAPKGTNPAWIPCAGVSNTHRNALNTAAACSCGTRGCTDNIRGPFGVRIYGCCRAFVPRETFAVGTPAIRALRAEPALVGVWKGMAGFWPVVCDSGSEALTKHNALTNVANVLSAISEASWEPWLKHPGKNQANGATTFLRGIKLEKKPFKSCKTTHSKISE